jgi:hypothetical protein
MTYCKLFVLQRVPPQSGRLCTGLQGSPDHRLAPEEDHFTMPAQAASSEAADSTTTAKKVENGTVQLLQHLEGSATNGLLGVGWLRAGPPKPKQKALVSRAVGDSHRKMKTCRACMLAHRTPPQTCAAHCLQVLEMLAKVSAELDAAQQEAESGCVQSPSTSMLRRACHGNNPHRHLPTYCVTLLYC